MFAISKRIGVDLGTVNSFVWLQGSGIVLEEPTVVAVALKDRRVVAVGTLAKNMLGRTPGTIIASKPLKYGVIADYAVTEALMRFFLQKVMGRGLLLKPEVMVSVPAGSTQVERRAVLEATLSAGARKAYLLDEPLAAIIGAGIPIAEASGNMVLNVGGGAAEAAVVSLGGVVASKSVRVGGNALDQAIQKYVKKQHGIMIGEMTAEAIKIQIGSAFPLSSKSKSISPSIASETSTLTGTSPATSPATTGASLITATSMAVKGRDAIHGMPREIELTNEEVCGAIQRPLNQIVEMVKRVLEEVPPELASDIIDKGLMMTGGASQLTGLDKRIADEVGIPVSIAEDPLHCVIKGIGVVLDDLDTYRHVLREK